MSRSSPNLTPADLRRLRLRSQLLTAGTNGGGRSTAAATAEDAATVEDTVRQLLAVQAQHLGGALWSVGQRTPGNTRREAAAVVDSGVVVLTWAMRGTLHLIHADDAGWLLALVGPRTWRSLSRLWRDAGLTDAVFDQAAEVVLDAMGPDALPRPAALKIMNEAGIDTTGQRGSHILRHLAERRLIIFGPLQGKTQTFLRFEDRLPKTAGAAEPDRDESLRRLALRYMAGHGPATAQDLAWWSGLTLTDARAGLAMAGPDLVRIEVDGCTYHLTPEVCDTLGPATRTPEPDPPAAHLLPGFDEYHIGYADRRLILRAEDAGWVGPGRNGMFRPPVEFGGRIRGIWSPTVQPDSVTVEATLFDAVPGQGPAAGSVAGDLGAGESGAVHAAARDYARFLELPLEQ